MIHADKEGNDHCRKNFITRLLLRNIHFFLQRCNLSIPHESPCGIEIVMCVFSKLRPHPMCIHRIHDHAFIIILNL